MKYAWIEVFKKRWPLEVMCRVLDARQEPTKLTDPVCGMAVTAESSHHLEHESKPYYFCSARCQSKFAADPPAYIGKTAVRGAAAAPVAAAAPSGAQPAGSIYTCPMHPEIRQDHPGNCPKCGMTLELVAPTLDDDDNPELASFTRRFWWTLPLTVIVTTLAMFGHQLGWFDMATQSLFLMATRWCCCMASSKRGRRLPNRNWTWKESGANC